MTPQSERLRKWARERAKSVVDPAQYGWCKSEGDGIKDPGIDQLTGDVEQAILDGMGEALAEARKVVMLAYREKDAVRLMAEIEALKPSLKERGA